MSKLDIVKTHLGNSGFSLKDYIEGELLRELEKDPNFGLDIYTVDDGGDVYLIFDLQDEGKYYVSYIYKEYYNTIEDVEPLSPALYNHLMSVLDLELETIQKAKEKLKDKNLEAANVLITEFEAE